MTFYDRDVPDLEDECCGYEDNTRKSYNLRIRNTFKKTVAQKSVQKHGNVMYPYVCSSSREYDMNIEEKNSAHRWGTLNQLMKCIVVCFMAIIIYSMHQTISQKRENVDNLRNAIQHAQIASKEMKLEMHKIHNDLEYLVTKVRLGGKDQSKLIYAIEEDVHREEAINAITEAYHHQSGRLDNLKEYIQHLHHTELINRYGPGPYLVEFQVLIRGKRHFFTLQTAPINDMPHSIFTFMDMVQRKVLDNTVFIHHWEHITQAAPISPEGEDKREVARGELTFPEHGNFYRHEKYTVGFAGRPGGPEWYINFYDNFDSHGPGKQDNSKVLNDADPCFAEVAKGRDVVDLMHKISLEALEKKENSGLEFSTIETARIIVLKKEGGYMK